jgi:hypothetical protein
MLTPDGKSYTYQELNITDDDDVKYMFNIHAQYQLRTIELYVIFQNIHSFVPQLTSEQINYQPTSSNYAPTDYQPTSSHYEPINYQPTSSHYAPTDYIPTSSNYTPSQHWTPFDSQINSFHYSQPNAIQQSHDFDLNSPPNESHLQPWSYSNAPLSQSQPFWSSNASWPESQLQHQHPSTSPHAQPDDERPDVVTFHPDEDNNSIESEQDHDDDDAYIPPPSMENLDDALIDQPSCVFLYENHPLPVDAEIAVGAVFHNKQDCMHAIKAFHMKHSIVSHTVQSDSTRYVIKCEQPTCPFTLRASESKKTGLWRIATISNNHTCISAGMSQDHHSLDAKMICQSIVPLLKENLSVTPNIIVAFIKDKYNYTISYKKAWHARI